MKFYFKSLIFAVFCAVCLTLTAGSAFAYDAGDIVVRNRIISVNPNSGSDKVDLDQSGVEAEIQVEGDITLELDITYMINPNFGLELILGTTEHEIRYKGKKAGDTGVLPPTILAQYHFLPTSSVKPYAGIGLNYTIFYDGKHGDNSEVSLAPSLGLAAQMGVDFDISEKLFVNIDVKYISMKTNTGGSDSVDIKINPLVIGVGVGTVF